MLTESIIIAILTVGGNILVSYLAHQRTSALMEYRLEQLEKKVEKHNTTIERTYLLEQQMAVVEHDIDDLKNK